MVYQGVHSLGLFSSSLITMPPTCDAFEAGASGFIKGIFIVLRAKGFVGMTELLGSFLLADEKPMGAFLVDTFRFGGLINGS